MALKITIEVWRKGKWFVAKCPGKKKSFRSYSNSI